MCGSIVEEMALTGIALDVNEALRAACGAAKMIALSEGVVCDYTIDDTQFKEQCTTPFDKDLPKTSALEQLQRFYVFIRAIQQGVQPPINIARLPEAEEQQLIDKIVQVTETFNSLPDNKTLNYNDYFLSNVLYVDPAQKDVIFNKLHTFIQKQTPIIAYNCKKISSDLVSDDRILGFFRKGPVYTIQQLENTEVYTTDLIKKISQEKGYVPSSVTSIYATNNLDKVVIKIITEDVSLEKEDAAILNLKDTPGSTKIKNIFYIKIKNDKRVSIPVSGIFDIRYQSIFNYIFVNDLVLDMHPYLMYLLHTYKRVITSMMSNPIGYLMKPPVKYRLAFYIIAHYIANRPPYVANPAKFYKTFMERKKPEMLKALIDNFVSPNSVLRIAINEGYEWLQEPKPTFEQLITDYGGEVTAAMRGKARVAGVAAGFTAGVGTLRGLFTKKKGHVGGKRVTRKVKHQIEVPL